ncbi:MAG: 16S rRNA (guanine(527)-N(7))-methyltransferase RsmG [Terriglobales bacterium]
MDSDRIAELLQPFLPRLGTSQNPALCLSPEQLHHISTYIDLLLHWNARVNLTAIRQPEAIVTRHFGESLFAAHHLLPSLPPAPPASAGRLSDIGSGAGFPGLAIKMWAPDLAVTLIESTHKKATFLREVIRTLTLTDVDVFPGRAEDFSTPSKLVTLRAVERFEQILPIAVHLVADRGRLALLIGEAQAKRARELAPELRWSEAVPIPLSANRVLLIGNRRP